MAVVKKVKYEKRHKKPAPVKRMGERGTITTR